MELKIVQSAFDNRRVFHAEKRPRIDVGHIFNSIIKNPNSHENQNERTLLYMIFHHYQSALMKLRTKNYSYANYFIEQAKLLENKLDSQNSKIAITGISLPLLAFKHYVLKNYDEAKVVLNESLISFEKMQVIGIEDSIWAKREQFLNLIRVEMNQDQYNKAFELAGKVISSFVNFEVETALISDEEKKYLISLDILEIYDGLNSLVDSVFFKINTIKNEEEKQQKYNMFFQSILDCSGYNYLNECIHSYLEPNKDLIDYFVEVSNMKFLIPRSIEGLLLKRIISDIDNEQIEHLIRNYSSEVLKINFK